LAVDILIVEDDELSRMMLKEVLSGFGNCHLAENGVEAIQLFEKAAIANTPFSLLCVDLLMPQMNGLAFVKKVREMEKTHLAFNGVRTKIFIISASDSIWDKAELILENLCDAYIEKPFNRNSLFGELHKHSFNIEASSACH
jgi:two-component system chemotaxis response regulator CheY